MVAEPVFPHIPAEVVAQEAAVIRMARAQVANAAENIEVIGTTPTGLMVSITHNAWASLLGGGNATPQVQGVSHGPQVAGGRGTPQPQAGPSTGPQAGPSGGPRSKVP